MDRLAAITAVAAARAVSSARSALGGRQPLERASPGESGDQTDLSASAKLIEALLTQTESPGSGIDRAQALLPAPPAAGTQAGLALLLQRSFSQSGLFYESHLAAWAQGELPLAALAQEPQGRLPALPRALPTPGNFTDPRSLSANPGGGRPNTSDGPALTAMRAGDSTATGWQQIVDPRLGPIVHQQLLSLDSQILPWQGQVWPGQHVDWTITPEVDPDQTGPAEPPAHWTSHLRLELPQLGMVDAELRWSGQGCSLRLAVPAEQLAALRAALPALAARFKDAGVRAERILVSAQRDSHHE